MKSLNPSEIQQCLNCDTPLSPEAQFCTHCGQKRTTGRVTFKQLLVDFFENIFNLDSRAFLTARKLLIPGFLTFEYFKGRHKTYLHPFRFFLVALIALVATINWKMNEGITSDGDIMQRMSKSRIERNLILEVDSLNQLYGKEDGPLSMELDSLKKRTLSHNRLKGDSLDLDDYFNIFGENYPLMHIEDVFSKNAEELAQAYGVTSYRRKWVLHQKIKVMRDSRSFLRFLVGRITWAVLLLIPLLAVGLKILYWRKDFYYVEHFIFSVHVHSLLFFLVTIQLLLVSVLPSWTIAISSSLGTIYLLLAMRRFYQQSWLKTFLKFFILGFGFYWVALSISAMLAIILGVLLF